MLLAVIYYKWLAINIQYCNPFVYVNNISCNNNYATSFIYLNYLINNISKTSLTFRTGIDYYILKVILLASVHYFINILTYLERKPLNPWKPLNVFDVIYLFFLSTVNCFEIIFPVWTWISIFVFWFLTFLMDYKIRRLNLQFYIIVWYNVENVCIESGS